MSFPAVSARSLSRYHHHQMRGSPKQQTTTGWLGYLSRFPTVGTPPADREPPARPRSLFDDLIGAWEQCRRDGEAEPLAVLTSIAINHFNIALSEMLALQGDSQSLLPNGRRRVPRPESSRSAKQLRRGLRYSIRVYIYQNLPGDDVGVSKIKVMQTCLNKLPYFIVRHIGAFAVLEYHHSDTDAFAPSST